MAKHVVGTVDEFPPGSQKMVEIDGRSIGVFNVNGELFALLNRCPHQAGPLCEGQTFGYLQPGRVGEFNYSRPGEMLRCPWHGWEFDVRTGQSWFDPAKVRVRRYDVRVEPGTALLETGPAIEAVADAAPGTSPAEVAAATGPDGESEPGMAGLLKGPYTAETYPVSIEQQYVIVEIGR